MKSNIFYTITAACALALSLGSCDDNWTPKLDKEGTLRLSSLGVTVSEESRATDIDTSSFLVEILQGSGTTQEVVAGPYKYSEMPEVVTLAVGDYTLSVKSHEQEKAAWDAPYYEGTQAFSITENKVSNAGTVTCYFANVKVTIRYTEELYEVMGDDCTVTVVANDDGNLTFTKSEVRSGYFEVVTNSNTLVATFNGTVDGSSRSCSQTYADVTAGQHYQITYSLKNGNGDLPNPDPSTEPGGTVGTGTGVSIDVIAETDVTDTIEVSQDIETGGEVVIPVTRPKEDPEEGNDDPNDDPTPDPGTTEYFTVTGTFDVDETIEVANPETREFIVYITSENPLTHLHVTIDSQTLTSDILTGVGLTSEFDLAYPGQYEAGLQGLGLPTGEDVIGATYVKFDITQFIPLLNIYGAANHNFILDMEDDQNNEDTLTLKFHTN